MAHWHAGLWKSSDSVSLLKINSREWRDFVLGVKIKAILLKIDPSGHFLYNELRDLIASN